MRASVFQRIDDPEVFIGIVAPIGANIEEASAGIEASFKSFGYEVAHIKITDCFEKLSSRIASLPHLDNSDRYRRYESYIKFGDALRKHFDDDAILASLAVMTICEKRVSIFKERQDKNDPRLSGQR